LIVAARVLAFLVLSAAVAACSVLQPGERPKITIANGTELTVALSVNGIPVGNFPPDGAGPDVDEQELPPLPWDMEARTVSGRLLLTLHVEPGQLQVARQPDGGIHASIAMERIDLTCGTLWLWACEITPSGPAPNPGAGQPGDCVP
jgi:hypothetical protein